MSTLIRKDNAQEKRLENLSSRIDLQTHAGSAFDNPVTLTFDLLTSGLKHAESAPCIVCPTSFGGADSLSVFLSERGQTRRQTHTDKVTDTTDHPIHASIAVGVG